MTDVAAALKGKRVLVVEDDYFIAQGLVRHLRASGVDVVGPSPTVADALKPIEAGPLDGAVLDIDLRGAPAYPIADALEPLGVPFVFATGYGVAAIPERYAAVARLETPVVFEDLVQALFAAAVSDFVNVSNLCLNAL